MSNAKQFPVGHAQMKQAEVTQGDAAGEDGDGSRESGCEDVETEGCVLPSELVNLSNV